MDTLKDCKNYAGSLSLISTRENMEILLKAAEDNEKSYLEFLHGILSCFLQEVFVKKCISLSDLCTWNFQKLATSG